MNTNRTKNASRNIIWGTINKFIMLVLPFLTRTVMIYTMGMQYVGLGSLFTSILQVLSFAELGIGSALVFSMYKPMAEEDEETVSALLNFYRRTYRVIGLVILVLGLMIMPFLDKLIAKDLPSGINIYVLFSIYLLNNVLGYFLFAYKQSILTASQRVDLISKISMILHMVSGITQIIILICTHNYYLYAAVVPVVTCLNNILVGIITNKHYPQFKCKGEIDGKELGSIKKKVGGMVFQKIGSIVLSSVDTIVISAFLGLVSLALYQNYFFVIKSIFGFLAVIMQSVISSVGNSVVLETVEKNYADFKKFNFVYVWIVTWCTTALVCLYQPFMELWIGRENMLSFGMVVLFSIYFFVHKWCDILYVYQEACGIWWETKFVPGIAAIVNLVINIILVQFIGLPGILLSTIVAVVFIYDTGYAIVLFKTYFKRIDHGLKSYWLRQSAYFLAAILSAVSTYLICNIITVDSVMIHLLISTILCFIVPNIILTIIWFKTPEFIEAKNLGKKLYMMKVKQ